MKKSLGAALIASERQRQIEEEGWTEKHDDHHRFEELATAAACYALPKKFRDTPIFGAAILKNFLQYLWPWSWKWWKPTPEDRRRELVKAGALIAAEIDRLSRVEEEKQSGYLIEKVSYDVWFGELKRLAIMRFGFTKESAETFCYESWKDYYEDGNTPLQALEEDFSYGD